jgi:hypothetical protein
LIDVAVPDATEGEPADDGLRLSDDEVEPEDEARLDMADRSDDGPMLVP